jgi:hypothetical protein
MPMEYLLSIVKVPPYIWVGEQVIVEDEDY